MFHSFFDSIASSRFFDSIASFLIPQQARASFHILSVLLWSAGTAKSIILQILSFFFFFFLLIIIRPGLLAEIR